jgi:hypothetical protein
MEEPIQIARYVSLVVEEEIDTDLLKTWFRTANAKAPYGVVTTLQTSDDEGQPQIVKMVHRHTDKGHYYMIPVTRDLTEKEVERIVSSFSDAVTDMDFDIEATVIPTNPMEKEKPSITVDQQKYADVASSWAKRQHDEWLKKRTEDGWRYGQVISLANKSHPLLRPWDDLPARYRNVDLEQPQKLLDLLGDHGYVVVSKEDLEAVTRLFHQL